MSTGDDTVPKFHDNDGFGWVVQGSGDRKVAIRLTPQTRLPVAEAKIKDGDLVIESKPGLPPKKFYVPIDVIEALRNS